MNWKQPPRDLSKPLRWLETPPQPFRDAKQEAGGWMATLLVAGLVVCVLGYVAGILGLLDAILH
jgi:hypothetical protein